MKKNIIYILTLGLVIAACSSEDDLNHEAKSLVTEKQLLDLADSSPEAALTINLGVEDGQYSFMREYATNFGDTGGRHDDYGQKSIDLGVDLLSNDVSMAIDHWMGNYYSYRGRTQDFSTTRIVWNFYYSIIMNVNSIIGKIAPDVADEDLKHLRARAMAIRAYSYFNLVRFYQHTYQKNPQAAGVPLYAPEQGIDSKGRGTVQQVYDLILSDLDYAFTNVDGYSRPSKEKLNKQVVAGIYARVLLETGTDDALCAQMANVAKSGYSLMSATEWVNGGFDNIGNSEWMWGADINSESSTVYASFFSHMATLNAGYAGLIGAYKSIDVRLYNAISDTDARKQAFGDADDTNAPYANYKFYDATFFEGDYVYMRASEMYLIEAEALARSGNNVQAAEVLHDLVSNRDSAYTLSTKTGTALVAEIQLHRRIELWGEGFAWLDMKRNGMALERDYTGSNHTAYGKKNFASDANEMLFQIPEKELDNNTEINEVDQNPI